MKRRIAFRSNIVPDFENFDFVHISNWIKKWSGQRVSYRWMYHKIFTKYGIPKNNNCSGLIESSEDNHVEIWANFIEILERIGIITIEYGNDMPMRDGWIKVN